MKLKKFLNDSIKIDIFYNMSICTWGLPRVGNKIETNNLYPAAAAKSLQLCPTLCDPIDGA